MSCDMFNSIKVDIDQFNVERFLAKESTISPKEFYETKDLFTNKEMVYTYIWSLTRDKYDLKDHEFIIHEYNPSHHDLIPKMCHTIHIYGNGAYIRRRGEFDLKWVPYMVKFKGKDSQVDISTPHIFPYLLDDKIKKKFLIESGGVQWVNKKSI